MQDEKYFEKLERTTKKIISLFTALMSNLWKTKMHFGLKVVRAPCLSNND